MDRKMIDYLPPIMREVAEFQQISNAEQTAKERIWDRLDDLESDLYLSRLGEYGASIWENTLGITPKKDDDIEVRRVRIKSKIQDKLPYTMRTLEQLLYSLLQSEDDYSIELNCDTYLLKVKLRIEDFSIIDEVRNTLDEIVPAHFTLEVMQMLNSHGVLSKYPHYLLAQFTHNELAVLDLDLYVSNKVTVVSNQNVSYLESISVDNIENIGFRN